MTAATDPVHPRCAERDAFDDAWKCLLDRPSVPLPPECWELRDA